MGGIIAHRGVEKPALSEAERDPRISFCTCS